MSPLNRREFVAASLALAVPDPRSLILDPSKATAIPDPRSRSSSHDPHLHPPNCCGSATNSPCPIHEVWFDGANGEGPNGKRQQYDWPRVWSLVRRVVRSIDNLVDLYFTSVGRNSKLLLNVPPTRRGLLHDTDVARLAGMRARLDALFADDVSRKELGMAILRRAQCGCRGRSWPSGDHWHRRFVRKHRRRSDRVELQRGSTGRIELADPHSRHDHRLSQTRSRHTG